MSTYYSTIAPPASSTSTRGWLISGLLFPACAFYLLNPESLKLFDTTSALIYETGRSFSEILGGYTVYIGGAVAQLALPGSLAGFFYAQRHAFGLQIFLFWLGQNLINVSLHIAKPSYAYVHERSFEDWQQLLALLDLSQYSLYIGAVAFAAGSLCFMMSLILPSVFRQ